MSTYRLETLFAPKSVAVVGASPKPGSLGGVVLKNLGEGGFAGSIAAVNPHHASVHGHPCRPSLTGLDAAPDLVIVATPAQAVPEIVREAARIGSAAAIILTAGLGRGPGSLAEEARLGARQGGLRLVGPNCLGVLSPAAMLNASFAARLPRKGPLALVSQSGAIAAGLVEWAGQRDFGFSGVVSLGDAIDVDFGDCLDHFAEDSSTKAILLYVEAIADARKFMSAARKAARVKPVIVLKAGRHAEGAKAAATHTGALAGADAVYDAALTRAGCLRVLDLDEMFAAASALSAGAPLPGERLAILTNGGGLGVLAVDRLEDFGHVPAALSPATMGALDAVLPATWSKANPVDIIGDAPAMRYAAAMKTLLDQESADAILAMNCPTALTSAAEAAEAVIGAVAAHGSASSRQRPVYSVWLGSDAAQRRAFESRGIAAFETESAAIRGVVQMMRLKRIRAELLDGDAAAADHIVPDREAASGAVAAALADGRAWLTPVEVDAALSAYGIEAAPVRLARDGVAAATAAGEFLKAGAACVVKVQSRDITHKSDVDGVRLGLTTAEAVRAAADEILVRAARLRPNGRIDGVTIQPMIHRTHARELIIGVAIDPTFGPIMLFGHGGTAVEVIDDKSIALLPVGIAEARTLMKGARVSRLLAGYRNVPPADQDRIANMLVRLSRLVEDCPEIVGIDLNPVLADADGALALDARIQVAAFPAEGEAKALASGRRFAIRPYPRHLEGEAKLGDGAALLVRPMRPTDADAIEDMLKRCDPIDLRLRFLGMRQIDHALVARLSQLDYAREMAFVALDPETREILAAARLHGDANHERGEYAILVRSDQQERGIGHHLMQRLIAFAKAERYARIEGEIMLENVRMLRICRELGFRIEPSLDGDGVVAVTLDLAVHVDFVAEGAGRQA
jgi:acetyltransferase